MGMICINGARECNGCMACHKDPTPIGECVVCGDGITICDDYYDIDGDLIHDDCLHEWAKQYRKQGG